MTYDPYAARPTPGGQLYPTQPTSPAPTGAAASGLPPMGWYPDPAGSSEERYWDGTSWTHNLRTPLPPPVAPHPTAGDLPATATLAPWGTPHVHPGQDAPRDPGQGSHVAGQPHQQQFPGQYPVQALPGDQPGHHAFPMSPAGTQPWASPEAGQPAPYGRRLLGLLLDGVIIYVIGSLLLAPFSSRIQQTSITVMDDLNSGRLTTPSQLWQSMTQSGYLHWALVSVGVQLLTALVVFTIGNRLGGTPGHRAAGLSIVPERARPATQPYGGPAAMPRLSWGAALLRSLVFVLCLYLPLGVFVVGLWPLFSKSGRGLHDLASGSRVVRR